MKKIIIFVLLCITILSGTYYLYFDSKWNSTPDFTEQEGKTIVIPEGAGFNKIVDILYDNNIINHPFIFKIGVYFQRNVKNLQAGQYRFLPSDTIAKIAKKIAIGDVLIHKITIPEGMRISDVLKLIDEAPDLEGALPMEVTQEGSILPDTYFYHYKDQREDLLQRMKKSLQFFIEYQWQIKQEGNNLKTPQEVIILASIIEAEAAVDSERREISAVFHNRLAKNMRLQSDPTVIYALLDGQGKLDRPLLLKDLKINSPFNTYVNNGLPPLPINNPGKASIFAALNPAPSKSLFFVAAGNGEHLFADNYPDHLENVKKYREFQAENGG